MNETIQPPQGTNTISASQSKKCDLMNVTLGVAIGVFGLVLGYCIGSYLEMLKGISTDTPVIVSNVDTRETVSVDPVSTGESTEEYIAPTVASKGNIFTMKGGSYREYQEVTALYPEGVKIYKITESVPVTVSRDPLSRKSNIQQQVEKRTHYRMEPDENPEISVVFGIRDSKFSVRDGMESSTIYEPITRTYYSYNDFDEKKGDYRKYQPSEIFKTADQRPVYSFVWGDAGVAEQVYVVNYDYDRFNLEEVYQPFNVVAHSDLSEFESVNPVIGTQQDILTKALEEMLKSLSLKPIEERG